MFNPLLTIKKLAASVLLLGLMSTAQARQNDVWVDPGIWAYPESYVVEQGQSLPIYVSSESGSVNLTVTRAGESQPRSAVSNIPATKKALPAKPWRDTPDWSPSTNIYIGSNWPSGLYNFEFRDTTAGKYQNWYVTVKENNPGSHAKVLVLDLLTTELAYSNLGGKSLYQFNSTAEVNPATGNKRAASMTMKQPINYTQHKELLSFINWAETYDIKYEMASTLDLERTANVLEPYDLVVMVGHNEYWSWTMRDQLDEHLATGGNLMVLSGNTMWWQIRFEGDNMVSYKSHTLDPIADTEDKHLTTTNWIHPITGRPETESIGVSFANAGYHNFGTYYLSSEAPRNGGFEITRADHWVFAGTGLKNGDILGKEHTIAGYEVDGALVENVDGFYRATGADGTPTTAEILATTPAVKIDGTQGLGTIVMFRFGGGTDKGGWVFNAATIDWADGLFDLDSMSLADPDVDRITQNVFERFTSRSASLNDAAGSGSIDSGNSNNTPDSTESGNNTDNTGVIQGTPAELNNSTGSSGGALGLGSLLLCALAGLRRKVA